MLIIREAQLKAFSAYMTLNFENRMVAALSGHGKDSQDLRALIQDSIRRIARYGISDERDVVTFIEWTVKLGAGFENRPEYAWTLPILSHETLPGSIKIEMLAKRLDAPAQPEGNE